MKTIMYDSKKICILSKHSISLIESIHKSNAVKSDKLIQIGQVSELNRLKRLSELKNFLIRYISERASPQFLIGDKKAVIFLPYTSGEPGFSQAILLRDEENLNQLRVFFEHYWERSSQAPFK